MLPLIFGRELARTRLSSRKFFPACFSSWGNADNEMKPSPERVINLRAIAGGENREACVFLDSLQKIIDPDVGVAIMAILYLGPFAKESIRFIEKEDRTTFLRRIEDATQILLRLVNIFRDDGAQIDPV
jgi:hypothetical protein